MEGLGFVTVLSLLVVVFIVQSDCRGANHCLADPNKHCAKVRCEFAHLGTGASPDLVPDNPVKDPGMSVCFNGAQQTQRQSCCTHQTEMNYVEAAKRSFRKNIIATNAYLKKLVMDNLVWHQAQDYIMDQLAQKGFPDTCMHSAWDYKLGFDVLDFYGNELPDACNSDEGRKWCDQFLAMIEGAQYSTDLLLSDMYHVPWQEMNDALKALFLDLQQYILQRDVNINLSVSKFFDDLFPIAFSHILNDPSLSIFTEDYRDCLAGVRQHLYPQPFGDFPHKMSISLSKSLYKAKMFLKGLSTIVKAVNFTDLLMVDKECSFALTRLQFCSHCEGYTRVKPCKKFCVNVLRGCLAKIEEISEEWDDLVTALQGVMAHMKGPFSIQEVTQFLDTKVSGAIMHAMGIQHKFYEKVVEKCGRPNPNQQNATVPKDNMFTFSRKSDKKPVDIGNLQERLATFMDTVGASKGLYVRMADMLCNNTLFYDQSPMSTECWNGHDVSSYDEKVPEPTFIRQVQHNPEVKVSLTPDPKLLALKDELAHVKRLLTPQAGDDMMQTEPDIVIGGSGDRPRDHGYGFEDDEDFMYSGSGSGDGNEIEDNRSTRGKGIDGHYTGQGNSKYVPKPDSNSATSYRSSTAVTVSILTAVFLLWKG